MLIEFEVDFAEREMDWNERDALRAALQTAPKLPFRVTKPSQRVVISLSEPHITEIVFDEPMVFAQRMRRGRTGASHTKSELTHTSAERHWKFGW